MLEDRLLIWRFRYGSRDAFCRIYEKYVDYLLSLAMNMLQDSGAAEDVVQDVFTSFVQTIGQFRLSGSLKSYLAICVANRARDRLRINKRRPTVGLDQAAQVEAHTSSPVQSAIVAEELQRLERAMVQLPYQQREAIVLHLHGEMKFRQIATVQGVSVKTVQSRYRYGLDKLRSLLTYKVEHETCR